MDVPAESEGDLWSADLLSQGTQAAPTVPQAPAWAVEVCLRRMSPSLSPYIFSGSRVHFQLGCVCCPPQPPQKVFERNSFPSPSEAERHTSSSVVSAWVPGHRNRGLQQERTQPLSAPTPLYSVALRPGSQGGNTGRWPSLRFVCCGGTQGGRSQPRSQRRGQPLLLRVTHGGHLNLVCPTRLGLY